jgi:hypothetical protein
MNRIRDAPNMTKNKKKFKIFLLHQYQKSALEYGVLVVIHVKDMAKRPNVVVET